jgi:sec-independent protein translocase protein TatA
MLIILVIVMLIFGTSKISGIGKSLGSAIRDFRDSMRSGSPEVDEPTEEDPKKESPKEAGTSNE